MRFFSALSEHESTPHAADEVIAAAREARVSADVAFLFFTSHHASEAEALLERVNGELEPAAVVGCSAEGVIGPDREVERAPGVALLLASLPGVNVRPFHIAREEWRDLLADPEGLVERLGAGAQTRAILAFGDPFSTPTPQLLSGVDELLPGVPVIGGMASSAHAPGENVLLYNDIVHHEGMVGVSLSGALDVQTVVSQGCRPIGKSYVITKSRENVIETLGGRPALQALRDAIMDMPEAERNLLQNGLFIGRAISEYKDKFARGDFLVRNVMGVDNEANTIAVGDYVRTGQTVQFHVRDAATAVEDLNVMLSPENIKSPPPAGALLFSCNGRGCRLFEDPSHDVRASNAAMPGTPVAGFFAAGELGPVAGKNFIHGHTASFALFRPR
jgi:small ligand-binding sensory domain FIST